jgi:hypothetical protein
MSETTIEKAFTAGLPDAEPRPIFKQTDTYGSRHRVAAKVRDIDVSLSTYCYSAYLNLIQGGWEASLPLKAAELRAFAAEFNAAAERLEAGGK